MHLTLTLRFAQYVAHCHAWLWSKPLCQREARHHACAKRTRPTAGESVGEDRMAALAHTLLLAVRDHKQLAVVAIHCL